MLRCAREDEICHPRCAETLQGHGDFIQCFSCRHDIVHYADMLSADLVDGPGGNNKGPSDVPVAFIRVQKRLRARVALSNKHSSIKCCAKRGRQRFCDFQRLVEAAFGQPH